MNNKKNDKTSGKKTKDAPKKRGGAVVIAVILALACVVGLFAYPTTRGIIFSLIKKTAFMERVRNNLLAGEPSARSSEDGTAKFKSNLAQKFEEMEMRETDYSFQDFPKNNTTEVTASVPRGRPMEWIIWNIADAAKSTPFSVEDCVCASETNCTATFKGAAAAHPRILLKIQQSGRYISNTAKMAILIENFGFEANQATVEYLSFPEPLTVALIPDRKLAQWTAQIADEYHKEIVLLLPMEPLPPQYDKYKQSMVMIHWSEEQIRNQISQAAAAIPNFSGICNFHGARVMEDSRAMKIILSEAHKRKAYFVCTDVSKKSVAPQIANEMKVPNVPVQGAIDASHTAEQVRERLRRYSMAAEKTGKILIKAQPSPAFIKVLKEEAEPLRKNGIRLVYVSELAK